MANEAQSSVGLGGSGTGTKVATAPSCPDYSTLVMEGLPTAYWRLGELSGPTAFDSSGNGHDATFVGAPTRNRPSSLSNDTNPSTGVVAGDQADVPAHIAFTAPQWSIALRRLRPSLPARGVFFSTRATGNQGVEIGGALTTTGGAEVWRIIVGVGGSAVTLDVPATPLETAPGQWVDLVTTFDGTTLTFYVNNVVRLQTPIVVTPPLAATVPVFADPNTGSAWYQDETAFYPYALTAEQVADIYAATICAQNASSIGVGAKCSGSAIFSARPSTSSMGTSGRASTASTTRTGSASTSEGDTSHSSGSPIFSGLPAASSVGASTLGSGAKVTSSSSRDSVGATATMSGQTFPSVECEIGNG